MGFARKGEKMIKVTLPDNSVKEYIEGILVRDVTKDIFEERKQHYKVLFFSRSL